MIVRRAHTEFVETQCFEICIAAGNRVRRVRVRVVLIMSVAVAIDLVAQDLLSLVCIKVFYVSRLALFVVFCPMLTISREFRFGARIGRVLGVYLSLTPLLP